MVRYSEVAATIQWGEMMYFEIANVALWCLVGLHTLTILILIRKNAELRQIAELGAGGSATLPRIGSKCPEITGTNLSTGESFSFEGSGPFPLVLVFVSQGCPTCRNIVAGIAKAAAATVRNIIIFCDGTDTECREHFPDVGSDIPLLVKSDNNLLDLYGVKQFPLVVLIDAAGTIEGFRFPADFNEIQHLL